MLGNLPSQKLIRYKQGIALGAGSTILTSTAGRCYFLFFCQFGCQEDTEFDTFGEAGFFVVPTKGGDRVDDAVQLTEGLAD